MEHLDCLSKTRNDTDIISSYKETCKQLDICKEKKLREEHELQKEESALRAEEKHLIRIKNALWRRMASSLCIRKETKLVSSKSLECSSSSLYQRKDEQQRKYLTNATKTHSSSYVPRYNRSLQNRRIQRKIRHASTIRSYINYFRYLPRQNISNNPSANQLFNGINFY
ncbi:hypothetical protein RhiirA1_454005 [Rhizophagus irregularis]|uniref:Uncharacterized protein n=1 Tax=Rhizophagus irregularis TaxID=588596 RepID=A0A2N0S652_9GLOM|nr:hypothetical protein RhiirA1_454005 [Rhizophagus irregularis]CAB4482932.1 unnamed protein product [Rhizophagus irregularis]CAB5365426.1 unnamed protein product [Rhizophagus irregularis]